MIYSNLFVDSDVLLDMLLNREPFVDHTKFLLFERNNGKFKLNTSALIIANINYILVKKLGTSVAKDSIKRLIKLIDVLPFESDIIDLALVSVIADFEDAIQCIIAERHNCDAIITRNLKHYKKSNLPIYTAEQYLNKL